LVLLALLTLSGCALQPPARPAVYDFGAGTVSVLALNPLPIRPPMALPEVDASPALDSTAVLYRLTYSNGQQLHPYAQARWSMPPAQLVRQAVREQLMRQRAVLNPGDNGPSGSSTPASLRLALEEFSQAFDTPDSSTVLLRLRVTLVQPGVRGDQLLAQRSVLVQRAAGSADAPGGVRALAQASQVAAQEIDAWLASLAR
jgi:cholesterol transport system auxiliary component